MDVPAKELVFHGDGPKLEQVLLNLVLNGIEAVEGQGGGTVAIRARKHLRSVVFEIEDDGPGIPTPDAPIFDAFYSTKPNGTGLGLAITHRIVTDHGGSVTVESRHGRTIFRVSLPLNVSPETSYVI
jgi:signal transduction histidine kinase